MTITRIRMVATLAPDEIPNGEMGDIIDYSPIGLSFAVFDNGKTAYVRAREIEVLNTRQIAEVQP